MKTLLILLAALLGFHAFGQVTTTGKGGGGGGGNGPTNLIAFVDGVGGSDASGAAGNALKPFKTFDALLLATSNYPAGGTLQMAPQPTYSYGVVGCTVHTGVTNCITNSVNNYLGTLNAWGATILCTNGVSPIASLKTVPFVMNGGNIIGRHSPNNDVDPTNIFSFVNSPAVSGSYTWNGTSFFSGSDGLFVSAWPNNSTVNLNNCSFVSSYDTWNCGENTTNSGCVFNMIGTTFFASNWISLNPFYGVTVRSIAAQAGGTYYINGCQLTAIGGTNLTTCIEAGGGSIMYISGTTFTSSGPISANTYDLYVDDVNTVVFLDGCLIDTNKIGGPGKANVIVGRFAKNNVWTGTNTFTGTELFSGTVTSSNAATTNSISLQAGATNQILIIGNEAPNGYSNGIALVNPQLATVSGSPFNSPSIMFQGNSFTTAGSLSSPVQFRMEAAGQTGGFGNAVLSIDSSKNGAAWTTGITYIDFAGNLHAHTYQDTSDSSSVAFDITAAGNLIASTAGKGLQIKGGANSKLNTVTLSSGQANVADTAVTSSSVIFFTVNSPGGTIAAAPYAYQITNAASFSVQAGASDNSTYYYFIVEKN